MCGSCSVDSDCTTGHCVNGECNTTTCSVSASECTGEGGVCKSDGTCNCHPPQALCSYCSSDAECLSGHCDQTSGQCQTTTCSANASDCTSVGGACASDGSCGCSGRLCDFCSTDTDCVAGLTCVNGNCNTNACGSMASICNSLGLGCEQPDGGSFPADGGVPSNAAGDCVCGFF
jgi:hypothetical protein